MLGLLEDHTPGFCAGCDARLDNKRSHAYICDLPECIALYQQCYAIDRRKRERKLMTPEERAAAYAARDARRVKIAKPEKKPPTRHPWKY